MSLSIVDSTHLSLDEISEHWPEIRACFEKYCARFPKEETPEHMLDEVAQGNRRMWLVKDEAGRVILVPITMIETLDATGMKQLVLAECSGSRLAEAMPLLAEIESWAKTEHDVERVRFVGRKGWSNLLIPLGYKLVSVIFEKELEP